MTPKWTDKEIKDIKTNYPKASWDELLDLIPNRTKGAIKKKASELQLKKNTNVRWTKEEENCVEDYLKGKIDFHRLKSLLPNRSIQSINLRERQVSKKLDIGFCRYCGKFSSGDSQELNNHRLQCIKNPKSDNYVKPYGYDKLKEMIFSSELKQVIYDLFYKESLSFSEIRIYLEEKHYLKLYEQKGYQIKNLGGFPDIFLEIIGIDNWGDYDEISKKNKQEARRKSGFTAKLKEEMKKLFDYKCALCEKSDSLNVHHIDGDSKNNDKKNLIPLCKKHHYRAERSMCLRCGRELVRIVEGVIINEKDISELGDIYAYTCKKHPELALRIYHKRKLIVCSLFEMVKEKLNQQF